MKQAEFWRRVRNYEYNLNRLEQASVKDQSAISNLRWRRIQFVGTNAEKFSLDRTLKLSPEAFSRTARGEARSKKIEACSLDGSVSEAAIAGSVLADFRDVFQAIVEDFPHPADVEKIDDEKEEAVRYLQLAATVLRDYLFLCGWAEDSLLVRQFARECIRSEADLHNLAAQRADEIAQEKERAKELALLLKELRDRAKWTNPELAKRTGFSLRSVKRHLSDTEPVIPVPENVAVYFEAFRESGKSDVAAETERLRPWLPRFS